MNPPLSTVAAGASGAPFYSNVAKQAFFPRAAAPASFGSLGSARCFYDPKYPERELLLSSSHGLTPSRTTSHNHLPDLTDPVFFPETCFYDPALEPCLSVSQPFDFPAQNSLPILPHGFGFPSSASSSSSSPLDDLDPEPYLICSQPKRPCLQYGHREDDRNDGFLYQCPFAFPEPGCFDFDEGMLPVLPESTPTRIPLLPAPRAQAEMFLPPQEYQCYYGQDSRQLPANYGEVGGGGRSFGSGGEGRAVSAQSMAARERRQRITTKTQELGKVVPGGSKMNTAEMLAAAFKYVTFLQAQLRVLRFMVSLHQEMGEEADEGQMEELRALLVSQTVQEKLYTEGHCLVPLHSLHLLLKRQATHPLLDPSISDDLEHILSTADTP